MATDAEADSSELSDLSDVESDLEKAASLCADVQSQDDQDAEMTSFERPRRSRTRIKPSKADEEIARALQELSDADDPLEGEEADDDEADASYGSRHTSKPSKKRKGSKNPVKSKRGRKSAGGHVGGLHGLPIEVVSEIMCYLEPIDLLRLAGTCHYFRNTLMRRSAKFIWVSARQHVRGHLPDCPHWLSEPAFARLAFARECHLCSKKGSHHVIWKWSSRLCWSCLDESTISIEDAQAEYDSVVVERVPKYYRCRDRLHVSTLKALLQIFIEATDEADLEGAGFFFDSESFESESSKSESSDSASSKSVSSHDELVEALYQKAVEAVDKRVDEIEHWSQQMTKWENCESVLKTYDAISALKDRRCAIIQRLVDLGYHRSDFADRNWFLKHRLVNQKKALTEKIWGNIKDKICEDINPYLEARDQRQGEANRWQRRKAIGRFYQSWVEAQSRDVARYLPRLHDFWRIPCVFEACDDVSEPGVTQEVWERLVPQFTQDVAAWNKLIELGLARKVLQAEAEVLDRYCGSSSRGMEDRLETLAQDDNLRRSLLQRVDVYFLCQYEAGQITFGPAYHTYPSLLRHACGACSDEIPSDFIRGKITTHETRRFAPFETPPGFPVLSAFKMTDEAPAQALVRNYSVTADSMRFIRHLVSEVGEDPLTVTRKQLDALGPCWDCRLTGGTPQTSDPDCASHLPSRCIWTACIGHVIARHLGPPYHHFGPRAHGVLIWRNPAEPTIITELRSRCARFEDRLSIASCVICARRRPALNGYMVEDLDSVSEVRQHLREVHDLDHDDSYAYIGLDPDEMQDALEYLRLER